MYYYKYLIIIFLSLILFSCEEKKDKEEKEEQDTSTEIDYGQHNWVSIPVHTNEDLTGVTFSVAGFRYSKEYSFLLLNVFDRFENYAYEFVTDRVGIKYKKEYLIPGIVTDICFVSDRIGFRAISGNTNILQRTEDYGRSWRDIANIYFTQIGFYDEKNGYGLDGAFSLLKTKDGGHTWTRQKTGVPFDNIKFYDRSIAVATSKGKIYQTVSGGKKWELKESSFMADMFNDILFVTDDLVFVVGEAGVIYRSKDKGENWDRVYNFLNTDNAEITSIHFVNKEIGFAAVSNYGRTIHHPDGNVNSKGLILKTIDGGGTWKVNYTSDRLRFNSLWFQSHQVGFAGGSYDFDNNANVFITKTKSQGQ